MMEVKIHNAPRFTKRQNIKFERIVKWTPDKPPKKYNIYRKLNKLSEKLGYEDNFPCQQSKKQNQTLNYMREEFEEKMYKYYSKHSHRFCYCMVKKLSRIEKAQLKEELGLVIKENPVRAQFRRVDKILTDFMKLNAFLTLKNYI